MSGASIPLREFLELVGMSRSLFYRDYRSDEETILLLDLRIGPTGRLTVSSSGALRFQKTFRGVLAIRHSELAERLGEYAQKGAPPPHMRRKKAA